MDPLTIATTTAREAGALLLAMWDEPLDIREKALRGDLVTRADRASEALIIERLRAATPQATILGEEGGTHAGSSDERWIVDPLDGTTNYAHRYPLFCVSIAYERAGRLEAAAIDAPALGERYAACLGGGTMLNGKPARVSTTATIADAMVCTGFQPARYARNARQFAWLSDRARAVRRDGSAALDLAFVAAGRFDAFWEFDLHAWDVAAGTLLIREAGGTVTAIEDRHFTVDGGSIVASNGALHAEMRETLARAMA